jgi:hypothetical protein
LYPEDDMTTMPMRLLAAELTREKIFERLYQELPYACTVETEAFDESNPDKWTIEQTIYVQRESQRAIILGHKGQMLKEIGTAARKDMQVQFGVPLHLAYSSRCAKNGRKTRNVTALWVWSIKYEAIRPNPPIRASAPAPAPSGRAGIQRNFDTAILGRSHRSALGQKDDSGNVGPHAVFAEYPERLSHRHDTGFRYGCGRDGFVEHAGADKGVDVFVWEHFSREWLKDIRG